MMTQIIWQGFKFGLLLQLAIGPMCLLVFNTAAKKLFLERMRKMCYNNIY